MRKSLKNKSAQAVLEYALIFVMISIPLMTAFLNIREAITTKSITTVENLTEQENEQTGNIHPFKNPQ